jgi:hypothetical protein
LAKGDVIVSVKYREVFSPAIFLGDEMLEIGHWKNADFHPFSTLKSCQNDQSLACENKLVINIKKKTNYGYFNVSQQVFLRYHIADDFVYVVMKRHLCVESRLSALSAAILTSNGLIDRFSLWLPG